MGVLQAMKVRGLITYRSSSLLHAAGLVNPSGAPQTLKKSLLKAWLLASLDGVGIIAGK
jgi:hypothetical protein